MKFPLENKIKKTILVISDLHLGAGPTVNNRKNHLEDFHYDRELIEFVDYYSHGHYYEREVELIINGDFFDLLAVPFVRFFDDEYWSEEAALEKLKMITSAHEDVIASLVNFVSYAENKLTYILGNHDSELILPRLQEFFYHLFPTEYRARVVILPFNPEGYFPENGVMIKHGHEYELAHLFSEKNLIKSSDQRLYFVPPWGSYYVTRVINKFKESRDYINAVRPINKFMINGLIYDTLFTLRFAFSNMIYFLMVRFLFIFQQNKKMKEIWENLKVDMALFKDYESMTQDFLIENSHIHALIVGHTHDPIFREYDDGSIFINTGTWTKMYNLDFGKNFQGARLTFAKIDVKYEKAENSFDHLLIELNEWKGRRDLPFVLFR